MAIWPYDRNFFYVGEVSFSQRILEIWLKTRAVDVGVCVTGSSKKAIFCQYMAIKSWWGPHLCLLLWSSLPCYDFLCCTVTGLKETTDKSLRFPRIMPFLFFITEDWWVPPLMPKVPERNWRCHPDRDIYISSQYMEKHGIGYTLHR